MNRFNDEIVILTCSGKLGDDEVVCRWKRVQNTVMNVMFFFCYSLEDFSLFRINGRMMSSWN